MNPEKAKTLENYLLLLEPSQLEAYRLVKVFIAAVSYHCCRSGNSPGRRLTLETIHEHFPAFARKFGRRSRLYYPSKARVCSGVTIYFRDDDNPGDADRTCIYPGNRYETDWELVEEHPKRDEILKEALKFCRVWQPEWDWDRVTTTTYRGLDPVTEIAL